MELKLSVINFFAFKKQGAEKYEISFTFDINQLIYFSLDAISLSSLPENFWLRFLQATEYEYDFTDPIAEKGYFPHVCIEKSYDEIIFLSNTAAGSDTKIVLAVNNCKQAFTALHNKYIKHSLYI